MGSASEEQPQGPLQGAKCPEELGPRYAELRRKAAAGQYRASVKLHCIECCGWEYAEVKRCEIEHCALYAVRARIFKDRARKPKGGKNSPGFFEDGRDEIRGEGES